MMSRAEADAIAPPCPPVAVADCRDPDCRRWIGTEPVVEFLRVHNLPGMTYRIELLNLDLPCVRIFAYDPDEHNLLRPVRGFCSANGDELAVHPPRIVPLRTDWPEAWVSCSSS